MPRKPKLKIFVCSSVYGFENALTQICGVLTGLEYEVWNSDLGTIPQDPSKSNLQICTDAVKECDLFLGFIRPQYGSGIVGDTSITHEEFRTALSLPIPRWAMVQAEVTFARQLLKPYMYKRNGERTKFRLKKNPVLTDLRVFDLYNEATLDHIPLEERTGHWVQPFYRIPDILEYLHTQFADLERIRGICNDMRSKQ